MPFIISIILPIIAFVTFIVSILAFLKRKKEDNKWNALSPILTALLTVISLLDIKVPSPNIYPLDNAVRRYLDIAEVEIESDNLFDTYYSIDGTDPKKGIQYEDIFFVDSSTTVVAKNKFFIWWSDATANTFVFENLSNDILYITPTETPSPMPTISPTVPPTPEPTQQPTSEPTPQPTPEPTLQPTPEPTPEPISEPIATSIPKTGYMNEGQNPLEGNALITYVNQYRSNAGVFESEKLLNAAYTKMGGALYYLPNGNEYGYHYFWVICLQ